MPIACRATQARLASVRGIFRVVMKKTFSLLPASAAIAAFAFLFAVLIGPAVQAGSRFIEPPALAEAVASGALPPIEQRLPAVPLVTEVGGDRVPGKHGGEARMLIANPRDVRLMTVYGYARLVGYDESLQLKPDILLEVQNEDDRVFTFKLRPGHKWSDGHPFTAEDFRYYWEDICGNKQLAPGGPPRLFYVGDEKAKFEVIDETTVRYSWSKPNHTFLRALAGAADPYIYRPAHYLKKFHIKYTDPKKLEEQAKAERKRNWAALHNFVDNMYRFDNPDQPTLQPWINTTRPPANRFIGERNPYFHRVDQNGRQLPYLDRFVMVQAASALIPAKVAAGDADLQPRYLAFNSYTLLKKAEKRGQIVTHLWKPGLGAHLALYPNLNVADPVWRELLRDVRFRRALSLGMDREIVNQSLYYGLAEAGNNTVLPESPLFKPEYRDAWATLDRVRANRLLDQLGLTKRNSEGIRLLPDGRPLEIIVETAGEDTEQTDVLQLIRDDWLRIGVKLFSKPSQREVLRNRVFSGQAMMIVWGGLENGIATPDMSPDPLAPMSQHGYQWPKWGEYYDTGGKKGEAPDIPEAQELLELAGAWDRATTTEERTRIWHRMLEIHADQQFTIGILRAVPVPIVVRENMRNVPKQAIYNWEPGAHLGVHRMDLFWFE